MNQTTSAQLLLSPNALALAPTTTTKLTFISPPTNHPTCTHKKNYATPNKPSCTLNLPRPSTTTSPLSLHHTNQKACNVMKMSHNGQTSIINLKREALNGPKNHYATSYSTSMRYPMRLCSKKRTISQGYLIEVEYEVA
jgi:hypothetical protein